jgi:REP element-mobilizing transposase RayT
LTVEEAEKLAEDCVSSALARAQKHCAESGLPPVEVFAVVVMSNHLHLVVRAPGKNLAAFMSYFLARVAQTLNLLLGRVGPVFPRRYDAQPILDEEAAAGRIKYVLENPKKAGLVKCFTEWPGFVAVAGLHDGEEVETRHFDRASRGTCHRLCPDPGIIGESDGAMSRYDHRNDGETFHHFCPDPGINGETTRAMRRDAHRQACPPVSSPAL